MLDTQSLGELSLIIQRIHQAQDLLRQEHRKLSLYAIIGGIGVFTLLISVIWSTLADVYLVSTLVFFCDILLFSKLLCSIVLRLHRAWALQKSLETLRVRQHSLQDKYEHPASRLEHYKLQLPRTIAQYQQRATWYRGLHHCIQLFTVGLSILVATFICGLDRVLHISWATALLSILICILTVIPGYFKLQERGTQLQQTVDLMEKETRFLQLGTHIYKDLPYGEALLLFTERIELLKAEQHQREQQW